ncbi:MAG: DNA pilot protein [Microviridae sp.]|nr:MAG: DNA pilot protein [Microviridae sp.]
MPITAAGVTAAGGILGSILGYSGQRKANKQNIALAREQMAFQERMSNSAYQRAMADMRKAGLNPILAAKQPASTPGGQTTKVESALGAGITAGNQTATAISQAQNMTANTNLTSAKATSEWAKINHVLNPDDTEAQRTAKLDLHTFGLPGGVVSQALELTKEGKEWAEIEPILIAGATVAGIVLGPKILNGIRALLSKAITRRGVTKAAARAEKFIRGSFKDPKTHFSGKKPGRPPVTFTDTATKPWG